MFPCQPLFLKPFQFQDLKTGTSQQDIVRSDKKLSELPLTDFLCHVTGHVIHHDHVQNNNICSKMSPSQIWLFYTYTKGGLACLKDLITGQIRSRHAIKQKVYVRRSKTARIARRTSLSRMRCTLRLTLAKSGISPLSMPTFWKQEVSQHY